LRKFHTTYVHPISLLSFLEGIHPFFPSPISREVFLQFPFHPPGGK
jgi:hypothetical protein